MASILDEIVAYKRTYVEAAKARVPRDAMMDRAVAAPDPPSFIDALIEGDDISLIAEVKKASPSKGVIREDFDPIAIAGTYGGNGASAISVLTDEKFFQGSDAILTAVRETSHLPLLRKDFTIDPYQVFEARWLGASAVLLIAAILEDIELESMVNLAHELAIDALVEVHTSDEVCAALNAGADIIGINNRDLKTFRTDLATTEELAVQIPENVVTVSESGISSREDVVRLRDAGADAVLVGESLIRESDIGAKVRELVGREDV